MLQGGSLCTVSDPAEQRRLHPCRGRVPEAGWRRRKAATRDLAANGESDANCIDTLARGSGSFRFQFESAMTLQARELLANPAPAA